MGKINNIGSLKCYKDSLAKVCLFSALLQGYAEKKEKGESVRDKDIVYVTMMLKQYKQFLLSDKAMLGFDDGLSFMEDNRFRGFEICGGRFIGDRSKIKGIVKKWIEGFPESANNYQYEVSMLALALAFPDEINELITAAKAA